MGEYVGMFSSPSEFSMTSSLKGPASTSVRHGKQHGPASFQTPPVKIGSRSQSSLEWGREVTTDMTYEQSAHSEDLKSLVLKLMVKVDTLSAQVAEQQQNNTSNNDAEVAL
jgi:hypothetical protein